MKYRIKTITYENGRRDHFAQVKTRPLPIWLYIDKERGTNPFPAKCDNLEIAETRIRLHYCENCRAVKTTTENRDPAAEYKR